MRNDEIEEMIEKTKGFKPNEDAKKFIDLTNPFNEAMLDFSQKFGFFLCGYQKKTKNDGTSYWMLSKDALSNSQIRNFFGEIKRIQMNLFNSTKEEDWNKVKHSFLLVRPKLAYAVGRTVQKNSTSRISEFGKVFSLAIDRVESDKPEAAQRFSRFVDLFEAVLAYHKSFGGSEN